MKTSLYRDKLWVFRSGICTAFKHQKHALSKAGVEVEEGTAADSDVVHFNWYSPLSRHVLNKVRRRKQKAVVFAHTANDLRQSFKYSCHVEPLIRRYLARFYSAADLLIAPSQYCKELIMGDGYGVDQDICVISNGVDTDKFVFSEEKREEYRQKFGLKGPTIITAGQFIPLKGVVDFIEIARRMPEFTFIWFGPITNKWLSFSREMRHALEEKPDNLIIAGFVEDIVAALCCGDVFLFPSYEENQGIALLEAACIGLPIVLRPLPVYNGWLQYGENCLAAECLEEFVSQVQSVVDDSDLQARLSASAQKMAADHNLDAVGRELVQAYLERLDLDIARENTAAADVPKMIRDTGSKRKPLGQAAPAEG
jgi:1,2-diacylglycerol-3-alpha-glucose alpha-1,2-glucosyltransferase